MASPERHAALATMDADLKAKLAENGMEVAISTPDELKRLVTQDIKVQPNCSKPVDWCHSKAGRWRNLLFNA
ncbi:MAG: hypothetical protein Q8K22_11665 [Rhodoferax sp.]|nr:hypothetical protein [Rhodoferax sp.]